MLEEAKSREQVLVERFQGLSLAETLEELRRFGLRAEVEDGLVVLKHPILPTTYRKQYPGTLLLIRGTRKE